MLNTKCITFIVFFLLIFVSIKSNASAENAEDLKNLESEPNVDDLIDNDYEEYDESGDDYTDFKNPKDLRNLKNFWKLKIQEDEVQKNKSEETATKITTESPEVSELNKQEEHDLEITKRTNEILLNIEKRVLLAMIKEKTYGSETKAQEADKQKFEDINKSKQNLNLFQKDILLTKDQAQELILHAIKDAKKNNVDIHDINTVIN
uniref:Uncharacterized protein n=1 Tax=Strongyloides papillosus TaxID=174720 RepID=A0A0N5CH32_STREA